MVSHRIWHILHLFFNMFFCQTGVITMTTTMLLLLLLLMMMIMVVMMMIEIMVKMLM